MRILITGATGFIGRYILDRLRALGINIVAVGRTKPNNFDGDFIEADLLEIEKHRKIVELSGATHLIHLAWYVEHGKYLDSSLNVKWIQASANLAQEFCQAGGKKIVCAGTCFEYDLSYGFLREDFTPLNPTTIYGICKDTTRRLIANICEKSGVSFVWGRIFYVYGIGEDKNRLIPSLIKVFQGKREPFRINNINALIDYLCVEDVADAFIKLTLSEAEGCYNIASMVPIRIYDIVLTLADIFKKDAAEILSHLAGNNKDTDLIIIGDNRKISILGWKQNISLHDYLRSRYAKI